MSFDTQVPSFQRNMLNPHSILKMEAAGYFETLELTSRVKRLPSVGVQSLSYPLFVLKKVSIRWFCTFLHKFLGSIYITHISFSGTAEYKITNYLTGMCIAFTVHLNMGTYV
jgi:hypothetical protein